MGKLLARSLTTAMSTAMSTALFVLLSMAHPFQSVAQAKKAEKACVKSKATYYTPTLQGKLMANGKPYSRTEYAVAFNKWKLGTLVKITNLATHVTIYARITDRKKSDWSIDLSELAYSALGVVQRSGWGWVCVEAVKE